MVGGSFEIVKMVGTVGFEPTYDGIKIRELKPLADVPI